MFDLGWTELLVIGIVALIVVGPKDLPVLFKKGGQFVGRLKGMAREFSSAMNEAADDAGVGDINKTLKAATNPMQTGFDSVKDAASEFTKWTPESETGKLAAEQPQSPLPRLPKPSQSPRRPNPWQRHQNLPRIVNEH